MSRITINSNLAASNSQLRLAQSTHALSKNLTHLSSGLRINRASDDSAGLAIAQSLNADHRVLRQGVRNLNDGVSLLRIADGALNELSNITIRLTELAEQAANGALTHTQRKALDEEGQALKREYTRIAQSTEFNGLKLFGGTLGDVRLQVGYGETGGVVSNLGGAIGNGSFGTPATFLGTTGSNVSQVVIGDLNSDGILDIVDTRWVRMGAGDGSFSSVLSFSQTASSVALGDTNNDGILDIVLAGINGTDGLAYVFRGNGDGTFKAVSSFNADAGSSSDVRLADVNGDDNLDIVTVGVNDSSNGTGTVLLGVGSGNFSTSASFGICSSGASDLSLEDINNDGIVDIAISGSLGGNGITGVLLGDGSGGFGPVQTYQISSQNFVDTQLGDFNNDGNLDIVSLGSALFVRLGDGTGSFSAAKSFQTGITSQAALALADVNGDGTLDVVSAGNYNSWYGAARVHIGDGSGNFTSGDFIAGVGSGGTGDNTASVELADLNGDGVLDLALSGSDTSSVGLQTRLGNSLSGVAPLLDFSLETMADARQAMSMLAQKRVQLAAQRGKIGATEARIHTALNTTEIGIENIRSAESQIVDADVAAESAQLVKNRILQQAGIAVLAQANQAPALALVLLSRNT